jgi:hypothetical protein
MPPLSLTDEEMSLLRELAAPIPLRQRQKFLLAIAAELESEQTAGADIGPRVDSQGRGPASTSLRADGAAHGGEIRADVPRLAKLAKMRRDQVAVSVF